MGMDVIGVNPTSEAGLYFRRNVWGWHPLARLVCHLAPAETSACSLWHTNDGDGLDAAQARGLADRLQQFVDDGTVDKQIKARDKRLAALADEPCTYCNGSGVRTDARGIELGFDKHIIGPDTRANIAHPRFGQTGWCNSCNGIGHSRPSETLYPLDAEDVVAFIAFLSDCGGFEIC